jgi:D-glycerate 3-kinase
MDSTFADFVQTAGLPKVLLAYQSTLYQPLADWIVKSRFKVVGIQGTQGSGKSTLAEALKWHLQEQGMRVEVLSIDDLYLSRADRQTLAQSTHPLLATRGVPGTHDVALGREVLSWVKAGSGSFALPRFDKSRDDRVPRTDWHHCESPPDVLLFEGWCVGIPPQTDAELRQPVNELEAAEDPSGEWRRFVNDQLRFFYTPWFAQIDALVVLQSPGFEQVYAWRKKQEDALRASRQGQGVMNDSALRRFISHYERLTRHALETLPNHADVLVPLGNNQRPSTLQWLKSGSNR